MDTKDQLIDPRHGELAELYGRRVVVGAKQLRKALENDRAVFVYLAEDADPAITAALEQQCQVHNVPYAWIPTMGELGRACGIDVGAAAAAAVR